MKRSLNAVGALAAVAVPAAVAGLAAVPAAALASGRTTVTVRVEGLHRTLLPAKRVRTHGGWITRGGAPKGTCPASGAAGALDIATHRRWTGSYGTLGLSITSIFGERHRFTSRYYWSIYVNDRYASVGICELKLKRGEQLLLAAVPDKGSEYPIVLSAPRHARSGHAFKVRASGYSGSALRPLAGVRVDGHLTDAGGVAKVTLHGSGRKRITATRSGWIRDEATVTVRH